MNLFEVNIGDNYYKLRYPFPKFYVNLVTKKVYHYS